MRTFISIGKISAARRAWRDAWHRRDSAQATLEFLLVFPILLVFVMALFNFAGLSICNQLAQYAAFTAARIAIVNPEDKDKWAFLTMTPMAPSKTPMIPPLPIPSFIDELFKVILGIDNGAERAAYAYACTSFNTTFFDSNDKVVEAGGQSRSNLIARSSYVKTDASFLYFSTFPFLNELTQYVAQRNEIYVIGGFPIHFHDPYKAMDFYIFFGDKLFTGPSVYQKAYALDKLNKGTVVLPIYQSTMMGIN